MTVTDLAANRISHQLGYLGATLALPVAGLTLLIIGLRQRSRFQQLSRSAHPMYQLGYPGGPYPPSYPPHRLRTSRDSPRRRFLIPDTRPVFRRRPSGERQARR